MIQDIILSVGAWIFAISLIPTVVGKNKPSLVTCLITGTVLVIFAITYLTLGMKLAALSTSITGILWLIIAVQILIRR